MTQKPAQKKYRFIPYRKHDIVEMCIRDNRLAGQEDAFRNLHYMLGSIFHFEFHKITESLKDTYAPFDPDSDTRLYEQTKPLTNLNFTELLGGLLEKGNYERVTDADLAQALNEASLFQIRLHVDFDDFSEVLLFYRGESTRHETISRWLGLWKKDIEFSNYDRVVVYIRFREDFVQTKDHMPSWE